MNEPASQPSPFLEFLRAGLDRGGFETDDTLAALLPLFRQVQTTHHAGRVAPLEGLQHLQVQPPGRLAFDPQLSPAPRHNHARVESLQTISSRALEVVGESVRTTDLDQATVSASDQSIAAPGTDLTRPVFLPGYRGWEHEIDHHDALTDVFSLGLILASLACGLDLSNPEHLQRFVTHRENLFHLNPRLNPVLAASITRMTELNRHRRAQDLAQIISRLENYREQSLDFDSALLQRPDFRDSPLAGKRRLIQAHLRDRLFEVSRRNRLIYHKPTLQSLNLTLASVPLVLDYRNIQPEQLFVWHPSLAATLAEGSPLSLGKYLRFEDAPYIPGALDKIIADARRDRAEYGFAQLRLVLCFLHWNNLKEDKDERIHSPLLLLPVELTRKKGVRDNYVLTPTTVEAEVNPALRHHLGALYNLTLPESIDLKKSSLHDFHALLQTQIHASEPGVTLQSVDRPRIELIHERARQRLDQYRRRQKAAAPPTLSTPQPQPPAPEDAHLPLGLRLFLRHVRPSPMPLRDIAGAPPTPRLPHISPPTPPNPTPRSLESERRTFVLRDNDASNPYSWEFDLCSLTLGNFHYRKMTLVRDYERLIETDTTSGSFDDIFSLAPKPVESATTPRTLPPRDQHPVIACDATQASAIARARTGASYIIQGPPGTGKSQTITNLIADYIARGQRVLFVCEKRAAIDVVFHRLRQRGLDELCCLIHDSQTDKKAFIQDLKQTYERFLGSSNLEPDPEAEPLREQTLQALEQGLAPLQQFSQGMTQPHPRTGLPPRSLLHRLLDLGAPPDNLPPETTDILPDYPLWLQHGQRLTRLRTALAEQGDDLCFAHHPLRWIAPDVLRSERPLETLSRLLDQAENQIESIAKALESSGLPPHLWDTFAEIRAILDFAVRARPLAERHLLGLLTSDPTSLAFHTLANDLDSKRQALTQAREKIQAWRDPLTETDTEAALAAARTLEGSFLRFLQPSFWRLRSVLHSRYDFARHAIPPTWSKILEDLAAFHRAQNEFHTLSHLAATQWKVDDIAAFRAQVGELLQDPQLTHPSVQALLRQTTDPTRAATLFAELSRLHDRLSALDDTLGSTLAEHEDLEFPELSQVLRDLRSHLHRFADLSLVLAEIAELPEPLAHALRHAPVPLDQFEAALARKSLQHLYLERRDLQRFEGRLLARKREELAEHYRRWLDLNARCIRVRVQRTFLDHVRLASLPPAQLAPDQKAFKKRYTAGRRELEHEFGKTMRHKSIRDLAASDAGLVIRDLKPVWLMSPLGVSDTLPLDPALFDVVIFDEASQIPLEEAIPAAARSPQVIVVGDPMQLPPTTFFTGARSETDLNLVVEEDGQRFEVDLDADSFLTQSARNLPSTLLAWHYRSRYEALISFSNAAFYTGNLLTIPDRHRPSTEQPELLVGPLTSIESHAEALLTRSVSFHFLENSPYADRRNPGEADYIARLVQELLRRSTGMSIGIVAFSEAQQSELDDALARLADQDPNFASQLEAEFNREENDVFCGLFVKNLENVQGDERDIIILSVCYGPDHTGRMLMNFGPINQQGGEKRLNVILSRAKHHMAVVSSIRHSQITNDYNDGARNLRDFLRYADAVSRGDVSAARAVLENLNPSTRQALSPQDPHDAVVRTLAHALRQRGHTVDTNVGQSRFRCDLAIRNPSEPTYDLGIRVDTDTFHSTTDPLDRYVLQPSLLEAFGWRQVIVLAKDWFHQPDQVLAELEKSLRPTRRRA